MHNYFGSIGVTMIETVIQSQGAEHNRMSARYLVSTQGFVLGRGCDQDELAPNPDKKCNCTKTYGLWYHIL